MNKAAFKLREKKGMKKKRSGLSWVNLSGLEVAGGPSIQDHGQRW